jgi:lipopolysaccharide transport system permease protein
VSAVPVLEVEGGPGRASLSSLRELLIFRGVLGAFVLRQVKVKYKQAAIGIGWTVLQPLLAAAIFAVFLGRLAHIPSEGAPYFLFALCGMVAWSAFSAAASGGMESLVADQALVRKVYFPREVLPLAAVGAALVDLVPAAGVLLGAAVLLGYGPSLTWVAIPLAFLLLAVLALAIGLAFSAVNVYYRDARYALPFALQVGLFASPVVYPLSAVPDRWRELYAVANPVAAAIDGIRRIVLHHDWPAPGTTAAALAWAVALAVVAYALFKRLERGFSDRI